MVCNDYSRQHEFFEVIECLLADHDDCQLYAQLNQTAGRVTLPRKQTHTQTQTNLNSLLVSCLSQHYTAVITSSAGFQTTFSHSQQCLLLIKKPKLTLKQNNTVRISKSKCRKRRYLLQSIK